MFPWSNIWKVAPPQLQASICEIKIWRRMRFLLLRKTLLSRSIQWWRDFSRFGVFKCVDERPSNIFDESRELAFLHMMNNANCPDCDICTWFYRLFHRWVLSFHQSSSVSAPRNGACRASHLDLMSEDLESTSYEFESSRRFNSLLYSRLLNSNSQSFFSLTISDILY